MPIAMLLDAGPDGVLAAFAARGYRVLGPDEVDEVALDENAVEGAEVEAVRAQSAAQE